MKSMITYHYLSKAQNDIYNKLNAYSKEQPFLGRLVSIPAAIGDVSLQTLKTPLTVIEYLAFAAINLFGAAFHEKCNLKDTLWNVEGFFCNLSIIPATLLLFPVKLVIQIFAGLYDPQNVKTINHYPHYGDEAYVKKTCYIFKLEFPKFA